MVLPVTDTGAVTCGPLGHLLWTHGSDALNWNSLKSGPTATRTAGTKSSAKHNSHQPIIIGRKAPKVLKSLSGNLGISGGTQFRRGPVSVGRCRCFPQDFYKRFSRMIKQKLHLLFCKQRRRKT